MAIYDMTLIIGGILIPKPSTFKRIDQPNETDRITLGGTLNTYFINKRREWVIGWKLIKEEDFQKLQTLFNEQYSQHTYHVMQFDAYDIYAPVKLEFSDQNIKSNGSLIENFSMVIKEKYAVS